MLGLILDTVVLVVIIRVMEDSDADEWFRIGGCALLMSISVVVAAQLFPPQLFFLAITVAAAVGAVAMSALCGMSLKRAGIAASIFLGYKILMALFCLGMLAGANATLDS